MSNLKEKIDRVRKIIETQYGAGEKMEGDVNERRPAVFQMYAPEELGKKHSFAGLVGLDDFVEMFKQKYINPYYYRTAFNQKLLNVSMPNMLLYGPAGTGKTEMVQSLAAEMGVVMISVSASDIQSSYQAESKNRFKDLMNQCMLLNKEAPYDKIIVFFDEADVLLAASEDKKNDTDIIQVFKQATNVGPKGSEPDYIIWIAATNVPGRITDVGILNRFTLRRYVGYPYMEHVALRIFMLTTFLKDLTIRTCAQPKTPQEARADFEQRFSLEKYDPKLINDIERLIWFLTPRDMTAIMQESIAKVEPNPFMLHKYSYFEDQKTGCLFPRGKGSPDALTFAQLAALGKLSLLNNVMWGDLSFERVIDAIETTRVTTSLTWESLRGFWSYAHTQLKDYVGLVDILKTACMGWAQNPTYWLVSDRMRGKNYEMTKMPNWPIDDPNETPREMAEEIKAYCTLECKVGCDVLRNMAQVQKMWLFFMLQWDHPPPPLKVRKDLAPLIEKIYKAAAAYKGLGSGDGESAEEEEEDESIIGKDASKDFIKIFAEACDPAWLEALPQQVKQRELLITNNKDLTEFIRTRFWSYWNQHKEIWGPETKEPKGKPYNEKQFITSVKNIMKKMILQKTVGFASEFQLDKLAWVVIFAWQKVMKTAGVAAKKRPVPIPPAPAAAPAALPPPPVVPMAEAFDPQLLEIEAQKMKEELLPVFLSPKHEAEVAVPQPPPKQRRFFKAPRPPLGAPKPGVVAMAEEPKPLPPPANVSPAPQVLPPQIPVSPISQTTFGPQTAIPNAPMMQVAPAPIAPVAPAPPQPQLQNVPMSASQAAAMEGASDFPPTSGDLGEPPRSPLQLLSDNPDIDISNVVWSADSPGTPGF